MKILNRPSQSIQSLPFAVLISITMIAVGIAVVSEPLLAGLALVLGIVLVVLTSLTNVTRIYYAALVLCGSIIAYPAFLPRRQDEITGSMFNPRASVQLAILLAIALSAFWIWLSTPGSLRVFGRTRLALLGWYCGVVLLSLTYTPDLRWAAFAALKLFGPVLVLAVLAVLVQTAGQLQRVLDVMLAGIGVVLLVYWADIITGAATSNSTARFSSGWLHPNHAGIFASVFTVLMVGRLLTATARNAAWSAGLLAAAGVISILMIGSKNALASGIIGIALVALVALRWRPKTTLLYLAGGTLVVGLISTFFLTANTGIFAHLRVYDTSEYLQVTDLTGRVPLWDVVLRQGFEHPIIGHGYMATFADGFDNGQFWVAKQAHNAFIQTFFDLGMVGVVIVVALYAAAWVAATRQALTSKPGTQFWPLSAGLLGALGVVTSNSFSEDIFGGIFEGRTMLFLLIVFAIFQSAELTRASVVQNASER